MKKILLSAIGLLLCVTAMAQAKKGSTPKEQDRSLPTVYSSITAAQQRLQLYTQNAATGNALQHDVNSIILDIEKYIDSLHGNNTRADNLLARNFAPLRLFFLSTTNKTTVATSFLYADAPYRFGMYNDTALALHMGAIKNGNVYDMGTMTEKRIAGTAMLTCLLPALKAIDEFKGSDIKYIALTIYYGSKDSRIGAPATPVTPYALTLLARLSDIQDYNAGLVTAKGLLAVSEVYQATTEDAGQLSRVQLNVE